MSLEGKTSQDFFERRYRSASDPWNFVKSEYEQGRFDTIFAALAHRRYRHALEPGCSIGTLTERLATIADKVTAFDLSVTAVDRAKQRCALHQHVSFSCSALSKDTACEACDLLILSEIGYYFDPLEWQELVAVLAQRMVSGTTVLASHWLGQSEEHRQGGDRVHDALRKEPLFHLEYEARHPGFRLDRFVRN